MHYEDSMAEDGVISEPFSAANREKIRESDRPDNPVCPLQPHTKGDFGATLTAFILLGTGN